MPTKGTRFLLGSTVTILAALALLTCMPSEEVAATVPGSTPSTAAQEGVELATEQQKTLYAIGLSVSSGLAPLALTAEELTFLQAGLADGVLGAEPRVAIADYESKIQALAGERQAAFMEKEKASGSAFLDKAAQEEGAVQTASGMVIRHLKEGTGESPGPADRVRVHYHGTLTTGVVFDSSVQRGQPIDFGLSQVIPCWTEGVQTMKVGGKAKLVCPPDLAYGDRGAGRDIPGGATLVFEVELLQVLK